MICVCGNVNECNLTNTFFYLAFKNKTAVKDIMQCIYLIKCSKYYVIHVVSNILKISYLNKLSNRIIKITNANELIGIMYVAGIYLR